MDWDHIFSVVGGAVVTFFGGVVPLYMKFRKSLSALAAENQRLFIEKRKSDQDADHREADFKDETNQKIIKSLLVNFDAINDRLTSVISSAQGRDREIAQLQNDYYFMEANHKKCDEDRVRLQRDFDEFKKGMVK